MTRNANAKEDLSEREFMARMFEEFWGEMLGYLANCGGYRGEDEDILADLWFRLLRKIGQLKNPDVFRAWAYAALRHAIANWLRRERRPRPAALPEGYDPVAPGDAEEPITASKKLIPALVRIIQVNGISTARSILARLREEPDEETRTNYRYQPTDRQMAILHEALDFVGIPRDHPMGRDRLLDRWARRTTIEWPCRGDDPSVIPARYHGWSELYHVGAFYLVQFLGGGENGVLFAVDRELRKFLEAEQPWPIREEFLPLEEINKLARFQKVKATCLPL